MTRLDPHTPAIHETATTVASSFGRFVEIGEGCRLNHVEMSDYSYCDRYTDIANARIGRFANIAALTRLGPTDHPMTGASLHHFQYRSASYWPEAGNDEAFFEARHARVLTIGHDTWIGHGAIVKPGLNIGTGSIIGAGAVVTKDVPDYAIMAGNPAKLLRMRFDAATAERLRALAWWDWDHERLGRALPDFRSLPVEAFLDRYEV